MCGITTSALLPSRAIYIESGSGEGRALVMARAQRGPARQVAGAREGAPVRSDLGDHDLGHASAKFPGACPAAPRARAARSRAHPQRESLAARRVGPEGPPPTSFVRFIGLLPRRSRGRLPFDWSTGMYYTPARWLIGPGRARCEMWSAGKRIFSTSWERIELDAYRLACRARLRVERG